MNDNFILLFHFHRFIRYGVEDAKQQIKNLAVLLTLGKIYKAPENYLQIYRKLF
jgi:hypothetical protein